MSAEHLPPPSGNAVRLSRAWGLARLPEDSSLFFPVCPEAGTLRLLRSLKATSFIRLKGLIRYHILTNGRWVTFFYSLDFIFFSLSLGFLLFLPRACIVNVIKTIWERSLSAPHSEAAGSPQMLQPGPLLPVSARRTSFHPSWPSLTSPQPRSLP